jgi:hypothetical protein
MSREQLPLDRFLTLTHWVILLGTAVLVAGITFSFVASQHWLAWKIAICIFGSWVTLMGFWTRHMTLMRMHQVRPGVKRTQS